MNSIPPIDLTRQYFRFGPEMETATADVLRSGRYIGGAAVDAFEQQFATYLGVSNCVACHSGTDALYLVMRALNLGPGDEVITTAFSFIATSEAIALVGAKPVFVDIDCSTFNLDAEQVAGAITERTKAILPVHLFGQPADMGTLGEIAAHNSLYVIEDCAQATGASWQNRKVGSFGQAGCFSFFPTKNLGGCGDGGAVTTNDADLAAAIRQLKNHGSSQRYRHEATGINSRLDGLQAAILSVKLPYLDDWNRERQEIAARYQTLLAPSQLKLPQATPGGISVWNQYTVLFDTETAAARDRLQEKLQHSGIGTMVYYPIPLHRQPVYHNLGYQDGDLPQAEKAARQVLSLPMFPGLTPEEQEQIACTLKDCLAAIAD
ncbi:MAG: DegT/DnrJ/EryC1/StrS family aminotransferase [Chloroflexaceae bacterium]|nr:DegT/DnrJ/EryC1/StrS family aminotransferase [Chloroflexaceae bacterium]